MTDRDRPDELAALLALDALGGDERSDAERELAGWAETAAALADTVMTPPPEDLRGDTVGTALGRRRAGHPLDPAVPCSPLEAYRRTADDLRALLAALTDAEWGAPAHERYGPVRAVIAHLVGVEELMLAWVGARPAPDPATVVDHVEATRPTVEELATADPRVIAERWHGLTHEVAAACEAADPDLAVLAHDLPTDVETLLVLRTFELWAHTFDVCTATGRTLPRPEASRLKLMSSRLIAALPIALTLRGTPQPGRTARVVLTGDADAGRAGGSFDVPLDPTSAAGQPDVVIVADVIGMCLVAARRLPPGQLDATVEGDSGLAHVVLNAADAFARD